MLDFDAFIPTETDTVEVLSRGGQPTGWVITLAGPAHPKTLAWTNDSARKALHKARLIETQQLNGRKVKADDRELEDVIRENVSWVVARIVGWSGLQMGGNEVAFSDDVATQLLQKPELAWVLGQITEKLADEKSFTKASASA